ncbi:hypothetical protein E3J79_01150 [Candidatus Dependentiae bacterium]|nr:MAG: hypothetical protein E3J79_01150 [Candidatus Dependentiae bacterium]
MYIKDLIEKIRDEFFRKINEFSHINENLENLTTRSYNLFKNIATLKGVTASNAASLIKILRQLSGRTELISNDINNAEKIVNSLPEPIKRALSSRENLLTPSLTSNTSQNNETQSKLQLATPDENLPDISDNLSENEDSSDDDSRQLKRQKTH